MDKNMKIAVCDSDKVFLNKVEVILQKLSKNNEVPYITFKYENSYELLAYFSNYKDFDIVLLGFDNMKKNGYETAVDIRKIDSKVKIILVSDVIQFAIKGYDIQISKFLQKPVKDFQLLQVLNTVIEEKQKEDQKFFINKTNARIDKIYYSEIKYIETFGRHTLIHTVHGVYESYITMRNHLKLLENSGFVQSHSGYIVNLNFIKSISEKTVLLRDGEKVILSQKRKTSFIKAFNTYYFC